MVKKLKLRFRLGSCLRRSDGVYLHQTGSINCPDLILIHYKNRHKTCTKQLTNISSLYIMHVFGSLAQLVEQRTFNPLVEGSNPSRPTKSEKTCLQKAGFFISARRVQTA